VVSPHVCLPLIEIASHTSIQMALTLEAIWAFRNRLVHPGPEVSILATVKELEFWIVEHMGALGPGCNANTHTPAL
jgi:hypothetical protein